MFSGRVQIDMTDKVNKNRSFALMTQRERKRIDSQKPRRSPLSWVAVVGGAGWLIVVPLVGFTVSGLWLDRRFPVSFSWTLSLLIAGTVIGCLLAWRWINRIPKQ